MKNRFLLTIAGMLLAGQALAIPITEVGDAGQALGTAQTAAADTTRITGSTSGDADMFLFGWAGGAFGIDTFGSSGDTQLFLFDALGAGVSANDDAVGGSNLRSRIAAVLGAGSYYLGISGYNYDPRDASGNLIFPSSPFRQQHGAFDGDAVASWSGGSSNTNYRINFDTATVAVPEPGTLMLFGLGLLGLWVRGGRKA